VLVGTISADPLGILVAFGAGILSFLSPCVLPIVPGYLSMVSGLSAAELHTRPRNPVVPLAPAPLGPARAALTEPAGPGAAGMTRNRRTAPLLRGILLFVAGFSVVFVAEGAAASGLHGVIESHKAAFATTGGVLVGLLGLVLIVASLPAGLWRHLGGRVSGRVGWLIGEHRLPVRPSALGKWAAPVVGMAFAFSWTPCIGPVLGAVLGLAATRGTLAGGVVLLLAYSLGLGVPFFVTGLAFDQLTSLFARAQRRMAAVQVLAGLILVVFGILLVAGDLTWLSSQANTVLNDIGMRCSTANGCFT